MGRTRSCLINGQTIDAAIFGLIEDYGDAGLQGLAAVLSRPGIVEGLVLRRTEQGGLGLSPGTAIGGRHSVFQLERAATMAVLGLADGQHPVFLVRDWVGDPASRAPLGGGDQYAPTREQERVLVHLGPLPEDRDHVLLGEVRVGREQVVGEPRQALSVYVNPDAVPRVEVLRRELRQLAQRVVAMLERRSPQPELYGALAGSLAVSLQVQLAGPGLRVEQVVEAAALLLELTANWLRAAAPRRVGGLAEGLEARAGRVRAAASLDAKVDLAQEAVAAVLDELAGLGARVP